mmetsp:Transcript_20667/g.52728  ORF Transcript_20667/g.52728 Transcript_20667/m.52728 type:complete len:890 (+) Transcript_20667:116-2785(+)
MQPHMNPTVAKSAGVFGWTYNRANYKYDQGLRWQRYTTGRKMAIAQVGMFRQDVSDLASVAMVKLRTYGPLLGLVQTVCVTVFVEGRSGLKFPGPPVFISGVYLQCLGIGFSFATLASWLVFHAALRAQVMAVQLRTRKVRLPVPTQRQLDSARKILSTWEEQNLYDMFRLPFVMPNGADSPDEAEDEGPQTLEKAYVKGSLERLDEKPKVKKGKKTSGPTGLEKAALEARIPGLTPGNPTWIGKEMEDRVQHPKSSPSANGVDGTLEPFEHFELVRQTQKEYWGAEAYCRVCFLIAMMHLIQAFSYWITLHNIAELGMVWCANMGAAGLTAAVWAMFRLDVLPSYGGCFPIEAAGPFVTAVTLSLAYSAEPTVTMINISRGLGIAIVIMQLLWTFRLYSVAKPTGARPTHQAREAGGRLFNPSASCEVPTWLPHAFQHCTYLIAPPKTKEQIAKETADREASLIREDAMANVDMRPWQYTRTLLFAVALGWLVQLAGRTVECAMGERMLISQPGQAPWTRTGQWYGWESGPVTSKHYAHVTPQRGHWAWQKGWGPQGQQELWASDVFGFAPEADMWWAEDVGPEPRIGSAGIGENTWASGRLAYGMTEVKASHLPSGEDHDFMDSGGHRRLTSGPVIRPVVPAAVQWPAMLEPEILACGPDSACAALTASGTGAVVPPETAAGKAAGIATELVLHGLAELGMARSVTWGNTSFTVVTGSGAIAQCPHTATGKSVCVAISAPKLPFFESMPVAAAVEPSQDLPLRAMVAGVDGRVAILALRGHETVEGPMWTETGAVHLPREDGMFEVLSVSGAHDHVLVTANNGVSYHWPLRNGKPLFREPWREVPAGGASRTWQSASSLPNGKILRLASKWARAQGGARAWRPELLL